MNRLAQDICIEKTTKKQGRSLYDVHGQRNAHLPSRRLGGHDYDSQLDVSFSLRRRFAKLAYFDPYTRLCTLDSQWAVAFVGICISAFARFVLSKSKLNYQGTFILLFRLQRTSDCKLTKRRCKQSSCARRELHCRIVFDDFSKIPGSPVAYWLSASRFGRLRRKLQSYLGELRESTSGYGNLDDNGRFVRHWHEVDFLTLALDCGSLEEAAK